jgi:hypothetical protein
MLNKRILFILFFSALVSILPFGQKKVSAEETVYNCRCYPGTVDDGNPVKNYAINTSTATADACNQHCANNNYKVFAFDYGSYQAVTKTPGSGTGNPASHTCACTSGPIYGNAVSETVSVENENGCIAFCQKKQGGLYQYDKNPFKEVPAKTSDGGTPKSDGQTQGSSGGIITCGKNGSMCTLCDLIKGINIIIQYLLKIGIGVALASITIGGVIYILSAGDSKMIDMGKAAIKNAAIGLIIMFGAWLLISTTFRVLGAKQNLGITGVTAWGNFDCAPGK